MASLIIKRLVEELGNEVHCTGCDKIVVPGGSPIRKEDLFPSPSRWANFITAVEDYPHDLNHSLRSITHIG